MALDATVDELRQATSGRRFLVNVNGTETRVLLDALSGIGIASERVTPLNGQLEEALAAVLREGQE